MWEEEFHTWMSHGQPYSTEFINDSSRQYIRRFLYLYINTNIQREDKYLPCLKCIFLNRISTTFFCGFCSRAYYKYKYGGYNNLLTYMLCFLFFEDGTTAVVFCFCLFFDDGTTAIVFVYSLKMVPQLLFLFILWRWYHSYCFCLFFEDGTTAIVFVYSLKMVPQLLVYWFCLFFDDGTTAIGLLVLGYFPCVFSMLKNSQRSIFYFFTIFHTNFHHQYWPLSKISHSF